MSGPILLDASALFALVWPTHEAHDITRKFIRNTRDQTWATCTIVELALLRLVQNPVVTGGPTATAAMALEMLQLLQSSGQWSFLHTARSILDEPYRSLLAEARGYRTTTDIWLTGLALEHGGKLATLDRGIVQHLSQPRARSAVHVIA